MRSRASRAWSTTSQASRPRRSSGSRHARGPPRPHASSPYSRSLLLLIAFLAGAALAAASAAASYSYGRLARHALGDPGRATPAGGPPIALDRIVTPLLDTHPGATGILLVDSNREAFEPRARSARDAGRSLDLQHYIWKDGQQGRVRVREVLRAADRGVRVRVLLDDNNVRGKDRAILALDSHPLTDATLAGQLRALFHRSASSQTSYRLYLENGAWRWADDAEGRSRVWTRDPEAGFWRSALVLAVRWLPIESQL